MLKKRGDETPERENSGGGKKQVSYSVSIYIIILFAAVLLLIVMSYFVQQRNSSKTISDMTEQHDRFSTQALQNIEELQNRNLQLMEELEGKDAEIRKLQEELEDTRLKWTEDVKNVEDAMKEDYNKLLMKNQATEYMLKAEMAARDKDRALAREALEALAPLEEHLDEQYLEEYGKLKATYLKQ